MIEWSLDEEIAEPREVADGHTACFCVRAFCPTQASVGALPLHIQQRAGVIKVPENATSHAEQNESKNVD